MLWRHFFQTIPRKTNRDMHLNRIQVSSIKTDELSGLPCNVENNWCKKKNVFFTIRSSIDVKIWRTVSEKIQNSISGHGLNSSVLLFMWHTTDSVISTSISLSSFAAHSIQISIYFSKANNLLLYLVIILTVLIVPPIDLKSTYTFCVTSTTFKSVHFVYLQCK